MKDLVTYIAKQLVSTPEAVNVEETNDNGNVELLLTVDPKDIGIVIGKSGQTIKAIRKLLIVRAMADNCRVNLRINEPAGRESVSQSKSETEEA